MRVLYTKEQLEMAGINFPALSNHDVKEIRVNDDNEVVAIVNIKSDQYYLPQEPIVEPEEVIKLIETDEITDVPIMITESVRVPVVDEDGNHKFYHITNTEYEQVDTGEVDENEQPIFETVEVEVVNDAPTYLYTTQDVERPSGKYLKEVINIVDKVVEVEPLIIDSGHENWTEELECVMIEQEVVIDTIQSLPTKRNIYSDVDNLQSENAELWYQNMRLEMKMEEETSLLWYEIMMGGI